MPKQETVIQKGQTERFQGSKSWARLGQGARGKNSDLPNGGAHRDRKLGKILSKWSKGKVFEEVPEGTEWWCSDGVKLLFFKIKKHQCDAKDIIDKKS